MEQHELDVKKLQLALAKVAAMGEAIQELGAVPSGHLYAQVMDIMDVNAYESIISILVKTNLIRREGSGMLHWIGPERAQ